MGKSKKKNNKKNIKNTEIKMNSVSNIEKVEIDENDKNLSSLRKEVDSIEKLTLETLSDGFHKEIIRLFNDISKPFNDGKGEKEKVMLELLKDYNASYEKDIGIIVPALTEKPAIVCVSHIDLISTFNKGFAKKRVYSLAKYKEKEIIVGALDNTITNAVVMLALLNLRKQGKAENVEFLFTEGEEIDLLGMKAYLKKYSNKPFFVNLDVTNDNQAYNASIEYDEPNLSICKQINSKQDVFSSGFTTDRECDDLDAVIDNNGRGLSYCLPTWKTIHSYKNYTYVENLVPYLLGLEFLLSELDVSDIDSNFEYLSIKKALECDSLEKLEKKEKKAKKKYEKERAKRFSYSGRTYSSNYNNSYQSTWSGWGDSSDDVSENDFTVHEQYDSSKLNEGNVFFDYGSSIVSEEELLNSMEGNYNNLLNNDDDLSYVNDNQLYELEEAIEGAKICLIDYDIAVTDDMSTFISECIFKDVQWCKEDLEKIIDSSSVIEEIIEAWDDYYVIETIENGVYRFKSNPTVTR